MNIGRFERAPVSNRMALNSVWIISIFIVFSLVVPLLAQTETAPGETQDAEIAPKLDELLTTVYCYCGCERETIEVCVCETAVMIEKNFRSRLLAGQTVEQIRTDYLDTHGPQFYALMPAEGINLLAYIMPAVILVGIGGVAFAVLRKSRRPVTETDGLVAANPQVTDATVKQVEAELERYKRQN